MKKITLIGIVLSLSLIAPQLALADQSTDALIAKIKQQIAELTAQLAALQKTQDNGQSWCHTFNVNLKVGDEGSEVQALETALAREGFSVEHSSNFESVFDERIASAVTGFQEKYRDEILAPLGLKYGTGYVGKATRAKLNQIYGCSVTVKSSSLYITPSNFSLRVGETVQIQAMYQPPMPPCPPGMGCVQVMPAPISVTAKWTSSNPGVAMINAIVGDCFTAGCEPIYFFSITGISNGVAVIKAAYTSPSGALLTATTNVTVTSSSTQPSIRVLSPNGGETWTKGTTQTIQWRDNTAISTSQCPVGASCTPPSPPQIYYDLKLVPFYPPQPPCTSSPCPMYPVQIPYTIAKSVYGSSYNWSVGKVLDINGNDIDIIAPDGSYTVQVCQAGAGVCDSSDSYFKIVGGNASGNLPPTISGVSGPSILKVSEIGKWEITAFDPEQGPLAYSVVWGDEVPETTAEKMLSPVAGTAAQTATFTHVYSKAGIYNPTFTVTDNGGLSAKTSVSVNVSGSTSGNNPPTINGVPAVPASINVGQPVSFGWSATDADGDNLSWSVSWGDGAGEASACQSPNPQNKQGWSFNTSHAWANPGVYAVKATVGDCRGGSDQNVFPVTVSGPTLSSIRVLSPNGGEVWRVGSTETIKWTSAGNIPIVDITTTNVPSTYIASSIPNTGSYTWTIPTNFPVGQYRFRIAEPTGGSGKGIDDSDMPFTVSSGY